MADDDSMHECEDYSTNPFINSGKQKQQSSDKTSRRKLVLLSVAMFGMSFLVYLLSVGVAPAQVLALVGDKHKGLYLGAVMASGAVFTVFLSPLVGMYSDRLESRFGKRTPVMVGAVILQCILLFGLAWASPTFPVSQTDQQNCSHQPINKPVCHSDDDNKSHSSVIETNMGHYGVYFIVYFFESGLYATLSVTWNGLIADMTPEHLRGFGSGLNGLMTLLGYAAGAVWNIFLRDLGIWTTYTAIAALMLFSVMVTACAANEPSSVTTVRHPPLTIRRIGSSFIKPLRDHDFRWVFITRFLMQMGVYTVLGYIYFWMVDIVNLPNCMPPERATGIAMLPLMVLGGICGGAVGHFSDHFKRRKVFVVASTVIIASASAGFLTWVQSFPGAVIVAAAIGIGYGLYVTVDFALLLDVLPDESSRGNDMAVWHLSLVLPQFLSAPIAGIIVDRLQKIDCASSLGYKVIFILAAGYFVLSGIFIFKLKKVK